MNKTENYFSFYKLFICTRFFVESIDIFAFVVYTLIGMKKIFLAVKNDMSQKFAKNRRIMLWVNCELI